MKIEEKVFGKLGDGREVTLFTLINDNGLAVNITNYGAIITSIKMADNQGNIANVVCGFDNLESYISETYLGSYPYFGAIIGRFGNRIANGHLEIDGQHYQMAINNGPNHLHGGSVGFDRRLFEAGIIETASKVGVKLKYVSPHLEENYPGTLLVTCIYTLNNNNELGIEYLAETNKTTAVNLTNHSYFNLTGGAENILNHEMQLTATHMTEMIDQIPTGKIIPVAGTPFDFTSPKKINHRFEDVPMGYDDNFVLGNTKGELKYIGYIKDEKSGRKVEVLTTQPGMQVYTGYWNPEIEVNGEKKFGSFSGIALETQHYPDSVHQPGFPSTYLMPGEKYNHRTVYKFSAE